MARKSAGLLMFRRGKRGLEVLLVHPGGPFWAKKDEGAWMVPKGEIGEGEDEVAAAKREFEEETGVRPEGKLIPLGEVKQKGGKVVLAWAFEGDCDPSQCRSNTFKMEWPLKSGKMQEFPEVDKAEFFTIEEARRKVLAAQEIFLDRLVETVGGEKGGTVFKEGLFDA